ncbi:hypothetical protein HK102_003963 [Quaeritorhiza haematococci]|nr:hypothetical protein HK102_003963 [Quaeritorhiza haematococci]
MGDSKPSSPTMLFILVLLSACVGIGLGVVDVADAKPITINLGVLSSLAPTNVTRNENALFVLPELLKDYWNSQQIFGPGVEVNLSYEQHDFTNTRNIVKTFDLIRDRNAVALIGPETSSNAAAVNLIAGLFNVPQCSATAIGAMLADKTQYPTFMRTAVVEDGLSIISVLSNWKLTRIAFLYEDSLTCQAYQTTFFKYASLRNITVLYQGPIPAIATTSAYNQDKNDWKGIMTQVRRNGARVIVHCGDLSLLKLIDASIQLGMMEVNKTNSMVWASAFQGAGGVARNLTEMNAIHLRPYLRGLVSVYPRANTAFQNNTFTELIQMLYENDLNSSAPNPVTAKWPTSSTSIRTYSGNVQCLNAIVQGMAEAYRRGIITPAELAQRKLLEKMKFSAFLGIVNEVRVQGTDAELKFDPATGNIVSETAIINVRKIPESDIINPSSWDTIGFTLNGSVFLTSPPMFASGSSQAPRVTPIVIDFKWNETLYGALFITQVVIVILASISFLLVVTVFRRAPAIVKNSRVFLAAIGVGCMLVPISSFADYVVTAAGSGTSTNNQVMFVCEWRLWLHHTGAALLLGGLVLKNYRIHVIFNTDPAKLLRHPNQNNALRDLGLLRIHAAIMAITISLLIAMHFEMVNQSPRYFTESIDDITTVQGRLCPNGVLVSLLKASELALVLGGGYLAIRTRNTRTDYNEAQALGLGLYNWLVFGIAFYVIENVTTLNPDTAYLWHSIRIIITVTTVLAATIWYKFFVIFKDQELNGAASQRQHQIYPLSFQDGTLRQGGTAGVGSTSRNGAVIVASAGSGPSGDLVLSTIQLQPARSSSTKRAPIRLDPISQTYASKALAEESHHDAGGISPTLPMVKKEQLF